MHDIISVLDKYVDRGSELWLYNEVWLSTRNLILTALIRLKCLQSNKAGNLTTCRLVCLLPVETALKFFLPLRHSRL